MENVNDRFLGWVRSSANPGECHGSPCKLLSQKYHLLGGLDNTNLFLTFLEAGKSKTDTSTDLVSGKGPLTGL